MRAQRANTAMGRMREAAYLLALATALMILWLHAWSLSVTTRSNYTSAEPLPHPLLKSTPHAVALVDDVP